MNEWPCHHGGDFTSKILKIFGYFGHHHLTLGEEAAQG
jgi:hypothetical protein